MLTALMVEDSAYERKQYKKSLSKIKDLHIIEAENGQEALEVIKTRMVDLFLLDIQMPEMNGLELAQRIRALPQHRMSPILFVTGYDKNPLNAFREFHCYDYITKPFSSVQFANKIEELIESMKLERQKQHSIQKLVYLNTENGQLLTMTSQIIFAEMRNRKCYVCLEQGTVTLKEMTLAHLIKDVGEDFFVQCHKSFAINVRHISEIRILTYRRWQITLKGSQQSIELTKRFKPQVDEAIQNQLNSVGSEKVAH